MASDPASAPAQTRAVRSVFLAEDNELVRRGFKLLIGLESDLRVCGEADGAEEAFTRIGELHPDVAVVDLTLREGDGLELVARLRLQCPWVRILVVSMHDQLPWISTALYAGAHGYLTKEESSEKLIPAIRRILAGKRFLSERAVIRLGGHRAAERSIPPHLEP
jgi:DNA-binding NarL/FixJ family response regulator